MFVRSPTTTNPISGVMLSGSNPLNWRDALCRVLSDDTEVVPPRSIFRGGQSRTAAAIARICSGVVPQQPPTKLSQPFAAHLPSFGARLSGVSGKPVSESGSGKPAFGYALK